MHHLLARLFHGTRWALAVLLALALLLAGFGLAGQALAVPEAVRFYLALALFGAYLLLITRLPTWHRQRLRQFRQAPQQVGG